MEESVIIRSCMKKLAGNRPVNYKTDYIRLITGLRANLQRILEHFDNLNDLKVEHRSWPMRWWRVDDFLPEGLFDSVIQQMSLLEPEDFTVFENDTSRRLECRYPKHAPIVHGLLLAMNSNRFVDWIQQQSGINGLIPDPFYKGGGVCKVERGSRLHLHTDFNWNNDLRLNRQVNAILYVNETWESWWNGDLEFWDENKDSPDFVIKPKPNRLVFWEYAPDLVHGFPEQLNCPEGVSRDTLVTFYYNSNATWEHEPQRSQFKED